MQLILASTSVYRKQLLSQMGLQFKALSPDCDETPRANEQPEQLVERLAIGKAKSLMSTVAPSLIIGSDQVACFQQQIIGKPHTKEKAIKQLTLFSGQTVTFHTGVAVVNSDNGHTLSRICQTRVKFRQLTQQDIVQYIDIEQPLDCAGSFKSEGLGNVLFEAVSGNDPTALIGLPLITLCELLRQHKYPILSSIK